METIVISYPLNSTTVVTEAIYNGNFDKVSYKQFLKNLGEGNQSQSGKRWKLTYEMFIPENDGNIQYTGLNIPSGVILVADGGFFSGTANSNVHGNGTRIISEYEKIFSPVLKITGDWDVKISHPEWFGTGGIDNGDSSKIQNAINLISRSIDGYYFNGGKVVCKPYSKYHIEAPIYLYQGISFDGGNSNFIYRCQEGNYLFKVNFRVDASGNDIIDVPQRGQLDIITGITFVNKKSDNTETARAYGIYCASQVCEFSNIYSKYMWQTFQRYTGLNGYLDQLTLKNFVVAFPRMSQQDDIYQIDMAYIGDNLLIDNIHTFYADETNCTEKLLKVKACGGGIIQRIINGSIYIDSSKALTLSAVHQEFGNTTIQNSQIEVNGYCHFKQPGIPAFRILKRADTVGSTTTYTTLEQRSVTLKNVMILYKHTKNGSNVPYGTSATPPTDRPEIDVLIDKISSTDTNIVSGVVKIDNVFRVTQYPWTEASSQYGIRINNNAFMKNQASNSIQGILSGYSLTTPIFDNSCMLNSFISYQTQQNGIISGLWKDTSSNLTVNRISVGKYTYKAAIVFDIDRNIGFFKTTTNTETISIDTDNLTHAIGIGFNQAYYVGLYIRLYRTSPYSPGTQYVNIPVCSSHNTFGDMGEYTLFGERWADASALPDLLVCTKYEFFGKNVNVTLPSIPTPSPLTAANGWLKGDIVNNTILSI